MDTCPDEVLVKVCSRLDFKNIANLRLVNKHLAEVGAEALIKRVRFHCTEESLKRLHAIGHHDVLCKYVDSVVFEGNLLAQVPCIHSYQAHYQLDHHQHERPQSPPKNATAREKRLYERNVAKFNRDIEKKYVRYLDLYTKQQKLIHSTTYADLIDPSMVRFPRLTKIALSTVGRCVSSPARSKKVPFLTKSLLLLFQQRDMLTEIHRRMSCQEDFLTHLLPTVPCRSNKIASTRKSSSSIFCSHMANL